ncbi:MAG: BON domain-containing protein [Verrucomicrobiia bacterium]
MRDIEGSKTALGSGRVVVIHALRPTGLGIPAVPKRWIDGSILADPRVSMILVLDGSGKIPKLAEKSLAKRLQGTLTTERKRIAREAERAGLKPPKKDAYTVVLDLDSSLSLTLGLRSQKSGQAVGVYDGAGNLVQLWHEVPSSNAVLAAVDRAKTGQVPTSALTGSHPLASSSRPPRTPFTPADAAMPASLSVPPSAPPRPTPAPARSEIASNDRTLLAQLVGNGTPKHFSGNRVTFEPKQRPAATYRPGPLDDAAIESAIRARMSADQGLRGRNIQVASREGSVTLTGDFRDLGVTAAALSTALGVPGVIDVGLDRK